MKKNRDLHDGSWLRWIKSDKNVDGSGGAWISLKKKIIILKKRSNSNLLITFNNWFNCWWILIMMIV